MMKISKLPRLLPFVRKTPLNHLLLTEISVGLTLNVFSLILFIFLTQYVLTKETLSSDQFLSQAIYDFRTPTLTFLMSTITYLTGFFPGTLLVVIFTLRLLQRHKKEAVLFLFAIIISGLLSLFLKILFELPRPDLSPLQILTDFSYPSGHAMNNLVLYGLIAFYTFRFTRDKFLSLLVGAVATIWIVLIGFSRIYLGAHYPSDILAGYLVGFWWLLTVLLIDKTLSLRQTTKERPLSTLLNHNKTL